MIIVAVLSGIHTLFSGKLVVHSDMTGGKNEQHNLSTKTSGLWGKKMKSRNKKW